MAPTPATAPTPLLRARDLGRRYRRTAALHGAGLDLHSGESVALLGPNGAGKTTLLGILAGVVRRDAGTLEWAEAAAGRVGWVPQRPAVYPRLTARENLRLFAGLEGASDPAGAAGRLLEAADLAREADDAAAGLSTGTMQRLNICVALAGAPAVLLLDEPTATVSPDQRRRMWGWLERLRAERSLAVAFSTQSVDEAARHADRMLVLAGGRVAFAGTADELVVRHGRPSDPAGDRAGSAFLHLVGDPDAPR